MSELSPNSVALQLASLGRDLDRLVQEIDKAETRAVNAREDYTVANSTAFLTAEGAMDMRKHTAIVESSEFRLAAETAEAVVRGLRRQIDAVRVRIDIGRSMGVALRAEIDLIGKDGRP
jgi:hypothetical protein